MTLRLAGIVRESIVDGPGMRMTVFVQGCPHRCKGCHNPQTHDFNGGYISEINNILAVIDKDPLLQGVTFSGGEPFLQAKELSVLAEEISKRGLDIITYTGYTFEQLSQLFDKNPEVKQLVEMSKYIIDGRFVEELKSYDLKFRGSSNQRIIDVKETLRQGKVVEKQL